MGVLIDTSVLIAVERREGSMGGLLERAGDESVAISAISASELLHGVHRAESAQRRGRRKRFVEVVLETVAILPFDLEAARVHARIWADLRRRGELIGAHDPLIAATALAHDLPLVTQNSQEFQRIEGLRLVQW